MEHESLLYNSLLREHQWAFKKQQTSELLKNSSKILKQIRDEAF